ncbi:MAG: histidine phosphatase family protein [Desulfobacteraceae bacterium]|nr:histidine phosphatase family protein [Desulfobacteraceae bacterium]
MPLVYVIRHGQASFGKADYDELSKNGIRQSYVLGKFFEKTNTLFEKVCSGSLNRQVYTAVHALEGMGKKDCEIEINKGFNEYSHMDLINAALDYYEKSEGKRYELTELAKDRKEFQGFFSGIVEKWINGDFSDYGIETYEQYSDKVLKAFEEVSHSKERKTKIGVFTSGGAISVLLENTLGIHPFKAAEIGWGIRNCSVSVFGSSGKFNRKSNRFLLRQFNCTAQFELENEDNLITYR